MKVTGHRHFYSQIKPHRSNQRILALVDRKLGSMGKLELNNKDLQDLSFVKELSLEAKEKIEILELNYNEISDLSPLKELPNLRNLSIIGNQISDISVLSHSTNLKILELDDNQIEDLSSLAGLVGLESLILNSNKITDLSPIAKLTNLKRLWLSDNPNLNLSILTTQVLPNLTKLESLRLDNTGIIGNYHFQQLPLTGEEGQKTQKTEINKHYSSLATLGMTNCNLEELDIRDNKISEEEALELKRAFSNISNLKI